VKARSRPLLLKIPQQLPKKVEPQQIETNVCDGGGEDEMIRMNPNEAVSGEQSARQTNKLQESWHVARGARRHVKSYGGKEEDDAKRAASSF
jgi:hypothetical protein